MASSVLTSAEAAARLAAEGPNRLPVAERRGTAAIALAVVREPMVLLLAVATKYKRLDKLHCWLRLCAGHQVQGSRQAPQQLAVRS